MYIRYGTIKQITKRMTEFHKSILIENLIYEIYTFWQDDTADIIAREIDKLYVCYITKKGIQYHKDKMDKEEYEYISLYDNGIIGAYILLTHRSVNNIRYIRFCQSIVSGLKLMYPFIEKLEKRMNRMILPRDSLEDAIPYWEKYFQKKYGIFSRTEFQQFISSKNAAVLLDDIFKDK